MYTPDKKTITGLNAIYTPTLFPTKTIYIKTIIIVNHTHAARKLHSRPVFFVINLPFLSKKSFSLTFRTVSNLTFHSSILLINRSLSIEQISPSITTGKACPYIIGRCFPEKFTTKQVKGCFSI